MFCLLLRFAACCAFGLILAALLLVGLMFLGHFDLIRGLSHSGQPLAGLALALLPGGLWDSLGGVPDAASNAGVRSFLSLCVALLQLALVLGTGFFRLWYRP